MNKLTVCTTIAILLLGFTHRPPPPFEVWVVDKAPFKVPEMPELLANRTYYGSSHWCSYPEGKDYWYCGPMDGSQFYCQYFGNGARRCYRDFSSEAFFYVVAPVFKIRSSK